LTAATTDTRESVETLDVPVIDFVAPLPGFPGNRRFILVRLDEAGILYDLRSFDDDLRFLVAPPTPLFPGYAPEIDDESLTALGVTDATELLVLLVVTVGEAAAESTVNLMAPIVVHQPSRRAVQVVLGGSGLPVRASLVSS
jgi:flagellar assembly factor FliW